MFRTISAVALASIGLAAVTSAVPVSASSSNQGTRVTQSLSAAASPHTMQGAVVGRAHMIVMKHPGFSRAPLPSLSFRTVRGSSSAHAVTANTQCLTTDFNGDCPTANQALQYNGGTLLTSPAVYVVTFSTSSTTEASTDNSGFVSGALVNDGTGTASPQLQGAINASLNSPWSKWWQAEYSTPNATLSSGHYAGSIIVNDPTAANGSPQLYCSSVDGSGTCTAQASGTVIDDADIEAALSASPLVSQIATQNPNAIFVTLFRADQVITYGQTPTQVSPQNSVTAFCGYHSDVTPVPTSHLAYVVLPNEGGQAGCNFVGGAAGTDFNNFTAILSHELAETQTDPQQSCTGLISNQQCVSTGWIAPSSGTGYEIGDNCQTSISNGSMTSQVAGVGTDTASSYWFQDEWSNDAQGCLSGQVTPTISLSWLTPSVLQASVTAADAYSGGANSLPSAPLVFSLKRNGATVATYAATTGACAPVSSATLANYAYVVGPYVNCATTPAGIASWTVPSLMAGDTVTVSMTGAYPRTTYGLPSGFTESGAVASATSSINSSTQLLGVTQLGSGSVSSNQSGIRITAPGSASASFLTGSSVTLTATPASGSVFAGWSGGSCSGTQTTCTVTMGQAQSVTATFKYTTSLLVSWTNPTTLSVNLASGGPLSNADISVLVNNSIIARGTTNDQGVATITQFREPAGTLESVTFSGDDTHSLGTASITVPLVGPLTLGSHLSRGQCLLQPGGSNQLCLTEGGDLVEVASDGSTRFDAQVSGGQSAVLSSNGNFTVIDGAGNMIWSSQTAGLGVTQLTILSNAKVALLDSSNRTWWTSSGGSAGFLPTAALHAALSVQVRNLALGQRLTTGACLFSSSGASKLCVTVSGNVVATDSSGRTMWSSRTSGKGVALLFRPNGQLVVVNATGRVLWRLGAPLRGAHALTISNLGAVHVITSSSKVIWTSNKGR